MTLLDHEITYIADRLFKHTAARLTALIRATIRKEMKPMVDTVAALTAATDAALTEIASLVGEIQKDVALLAALPVDNTPAIEAQIKRLSDGTTAAAAAVAALQTAPAPVAAPAPAAPADAPAAAPAPDAPAPAADAPSAPATPGPAA